MLSGFGYCVWWRLPTTHPLYHTVTYLAKRWNTLVFDAHITVQSNLCFPPPFVPKPGEWGCLHASPASIYANQTFVKSWNKTFYSLELPIDPVFPLPKRAHLSLAYRFDRPFSPEEVAFAKHYVKSTSIIEQIQLEALVVDCSNFLVERWR